MESNRKQNTEPLEPGTPPAGNDGSPAHTTTVVVLVHGITRCLPGAPTHNSDDTHTPCADGVVLKNKASRGRSGACGIPSQQVIAQLLCDRNQSPKTRFDLSLFIQLSRHEFEAWTLGTLRALRR